MKENNDYEEELEQKTEEVKEEKENGSSAKISISKIIFVYCLLAIIGWYLFQFLFHSELFNIQEVVIEGNDYLKNQIIYQASGINIGDNIFLLNSKELIHHLTAEPWINEAEIKKIFPDKVKIIIRERKAIAIVSIGEESIKSSKDGMILCFLEHEKENTSHLPLINGLNIEHLKIGEKIVEPNYRLALEIMHCIDVLLPRMFYEVKILDSNDFLVCSKDKTVKVRVNNAEEIINKENLIREALDRIKNEKLQVDYIDLRFQDSLVIKVKK